MSYLLSWGGKQENKLNNFRWQLLLVTRVTKGPEVLFFHEGATREKRGFDFSETRNYEYLVIHLIRKNDFLL